MTLGTPPHDHGPAEPPPAEPPAGLELLKALVNTRDVETGADRLEDPAALARWLAEHGLARAGEPFSERDLERVRALREGLRAVGMAHNDVEPDPAAVAALAAEADAAPLSVRFRAGAPELAPAGEGVSAVIAALLAIAARAHADGSWPRFKACAAETCHWAFVDHSRNRSRTWCDMAVCGNRAKARAYRGRAR